MFCWVVQPAPDDLSDSLARTPNTDINKANQFCLRWPCRAQQKHHSSLQSCSTAQHCTQVLWRRLCRGSYNDGRCVSVCGAGILQEAMGRGEYWRLVDGQGRPPGLMGMWPSRAVTFIENHDTGQSPWSKLVSWPTCMCPSRLFVCIEIITSRVASLYNLTCVSFFDQTL